MATSKGKSKKLSETLLEASKKLDEKRLPAKVKAADGDILTDEGRAIVKKVAISYLIRLLKSAVVKTAVILAKKYGIPLKRLVVMAYFACIDMLTEMDLDPTALLNYRKSHKNIQVWDLKLSEEEVEEKGEEGF